VGSTVGLLVPLSPGIRQFAFTYELPESAFPLKLPVERPTGVFEVLLEEPTASVQGSTLREVAPAATEGRTFRRFLGQDAPANSVIEVQVPHIVGAGREKLYAGVGVVFLVAMVVALFVASRRAKFRVVGGVAPAPANGHRREPPIGQQGSQGTEQGNRMMMDRPGGETVRNHNGGIVIAALQPRRLTQLSTQIGPPQVGRAIGRGGMRDQAFDQRLRRVLRAQHLGQEAQIVARPGERRAALTAEQRPDAPNVEAVLAGTQRRGRAVFLR